MHHRIESYLVSLVEKSRNQEDSTLQPTPTQVDSSPGIGFVNSDEGNRSIQESQTGDNSRGIYGPPDDVFMEIIDSYFTYCQNQPYSFFHEDNFRRSLSEEAIPKHLILAMMATAVRFCSNPYFTNRALEMSVEYANRSWKLIVSDCFTVGKEAEVSAVQTVALLGLFDFTGMDIPPFRIQYHPMLLWLTCFLCLHSWSVAPRFSLGQGWTGCQDGTGLWTNAGKRNAPFTRRTRRTATSVLVGISLGSFGLLRPRSPTSHCRCIVPRATTV